ncbi:unnamed protein product, partial [Prorocentrum cordatum]
APGPPLGAAAMGGDVAVSVSADAAASLPVPAPVPRAAAEQPHGAARTPAGWRPVVLLSGLPGPLAAESAAACLRQGWELSPVGLTGPKALPRYEVPCVTTEGTSNGPAGVTISLVSSNDPLAQRAAVEEALRKYGDRLVAVDCTHPSSRTRSGGASLATAGASATNRPSDPDLGSGPNARAPPEPAALPASASWLQVAPGAPGRGGPRGTRGCLRRGAAGAVRAVMANAELFASTGCPFVMGTTGGDQEALQKLVGDAGVYALIASNMCKQIVALQAGVERMAADFPGAFSGYPASAGATSAQRSLAILSPHPRRSAGPREATSHLDRARCGVGEGHCAAGPGFPGCPARAVEAVPAPSGAAGLAALERPPADRAGSTHKTSAVDLLWEDPAPDLLRSEGQLDTMRIEESHQKTKADTSGTARDMVNSFQGLGLDFSVEQIQMIRVAAPLKALSHGHTEPAKEYERHQPRTWEALSSLMRTAAEQTVGRGRDETVGVPYLPRDLDMVRHKKKLVAEAWQGVVDAPGPVEMRSAKAAHEAAKTALSRFKYRVRARRVRDRIRGLEQAAGQSDLGAINSIMASMGLADEVGHDRRAGQGFTVEEAKGQVCKLGESPVEASIDVRTHIQPRPTDERLGWRPAAHEVRNALLGMKQSAAGTDEISKILLTAGGLELLYEFSVVVQHMWDQPPDQWRHLAHEVYGVMLFKGKRSRADVTKYRRIMIISPVARVIARIIAQRLAAFAEREDRLLSNQYGFRRHRSVLGPIMVLTILLEMAADAPPSDDERLMAIFADIEKAYPSTVRDVCFESLKVLGVPDRALHLLESLQSLALYRIGGKEGYSSSFRVFRGLKEGCPASPVTFNLLRSQIIRHFEQEAGQAGLGVTVADTTETLHYRRRRRQQGPPPESTTRRLITLLFADDTNILTRFRDQRRAEELLERILLEWGLKVNQTKCERLMNGTDHGQNASARFLGAMRRGDGDYGTDTTTRFNKAKVAWNKMFKRMPEWGLSDKLLGQFIQATVLNTFIFGCEVRPFSAKELRSYEVFWNRARRKELDKAVREHVGQAKAVQQVMEDLYQHPQLLSPQYHRRQLRTQYNAVYEANNDQRWLFRLKTAIVKSLAASTPHTATALHVMDALAQMVADKKRGAAASQGARPDSPSKKGKTKGKGKGKPKTDSADAVLTCLVRDHLHMRNDVGNLKAAANLMIIVLCNTLKVEIDASAKVWTDNMSQDDSAHPLGCGKRTVIFGALLSIFGNLEEGADESQKAAAGSLKRLSPSQMDAFVAGCKSRHNKYDEKRPWIFTLSVRPGVDSDQRKNVHALVGINAQKKIRVVHEAPRQGPEAEELWEWLKKQ